MERRLMILIFALFCLTGIRSEVSDGRESGDGLEHVTNDHDYFLHSFAEASLKVITKGMEINSLSNDTDVHQQLDYARMFFLSKKENSTDDPDLQHELERKIEIIQFLSRILNVSEDNAQKEKLENLNGYKNFAWSSSTKMENLDASGGMLLEDHTLEQNENGEYIAKTTISPSSESFEETTNENITLKVDILNQSQSDQTLEQITFPPSTEPSPGTTNGNMTLKNDTLEQSGNSQNLVKTTFTPPSEFFAENGTSEQTVSNTDSEHVKDVTEISTDNTNSGKLSFRSWLGASPPKSKTNSSHLNTTNISQILHFPPIGKLSRRDENQNSFYPDGNSDTKAAKIERILNAWKILLDELQDETILDKQEFLNVSSNTSVTVMEMNTTDPTSHPPESDKCTSSTLDISYESYSPKELPVVVTRFNHSHENYGPQIMHDTVTLKMNTSDFTKENVKRSGKAQVITDYLLNTSENKTDHSSSFAKSNDATFNDNKLTFNKQLSWIENIPLNSTGDSKEASSFIAFETKEFQSQSDLKNNTERNAPEWNLPTTETQGSNLTEDEFKNSQATTLISSNTLQSEANKSSTKQSSATVIPTIFGMNYTISIDRAFIDFSTNKFNKNETRKHTSSLSVSGNELPTAIEGSKDNDPRQSFPGINAKSLENMAPGINADKVNSRFPVTFISVNKEPSALRDMTEEYENKLEQSRSTVRDTRDTEYGQFREYSRVSDFEDSEKGNIMRFTKNTQRYPNLWKNPLYLNIFKIPTRFERFENEHGAKIDDSTTNKKMEKKSSAIVKILIPLGNLHAPGHQNKRINNTMVHVDSNVKPENMEEKFLNESRQSLQIEMKPFGIRHSNKVPFVYSSIKIQYIGDKNADDIAEGDFMNLQAENSPNNESSQLAKKKRSGGNDHW